MQPLLVGGLKDGPWTDGIGMDLYLCTAEYDQHETLHCTTIHCEREHEFYSFFTSAQMSVFPSVIYPVTSLSHSYHLKTRRCNVILCQPQNKASIRPLRNLKALQTDKENNNPVWGKEQKDYNYKTEWRQEMSQDIVG